MDKKKTGELIREARTKKNYTQTELGDLIGVTNKAVSRWENGVGSSLFRVGNCIISLRNFSAPVHSLPSEIMTS